MYKVRFYSQNSTSEQKIQEKWFTDKDEAFAFANSKGELAVETEHYPNLKDYPLPDLDLS
jgi:hypothetical protein